MESTMLRRVALPVDDVSRRQVHPPPMRAADTVPVRVVELLDHQEQAPSLLRFIAQLVASRLYFAASLTGVWALNRYPAPGTVSMKRGARHSSPSFTRSSRIWRSTTLLSISNSLPQMLDRRSARLRDFPAFAARR